MSNISDIVILDGARTAVGTFGGSLSTCTPAELGTHASKAAIEKSGVNAEEIEHAVFGHIISTGTADAYLSREISLNVGMKQSSVAFHLNRLCGSSIQSLISAAQMLALGDCKLALAGGAEVMSRGIYYLENARFGQRMGDGRMVDMTTGILADPFDSGHMGMTAERVAERYGLTREQLDEYAVMSHQRAAHAIKEGYFKSQITPVEVKQGRKSFIFEEDEHVRHDASLDGMAKLRPAFKKDGVVTAGNASGINDAACAMVMTTAQEAEKRGLNPRARIVSYGFCGVAPEVMGLGPIGAVPVALERAGLKLDDMDVIESNEAFAAQAMAVSKDLGFDPAKVNPNGSGISLGHPVGATGSIITLKTLYELERINGRYGLMTMCIGGGQGIAMIVEKL
ncbi:beta-ketothiolase BktB [Terasakiella pusilla]|uniref:beta-ketothiolase BktB n=1 Tax=Terasakiella pusilla TaxID=64973 RepID=UPI0004919C73|nr:beta-ketothiolase BktB [Terasakiella pusilla]